MDIGKILLAFFIFLILVIVAGAMWFIGTYNSLVSADQDVNTAWANVDTVLQRRFDLIPNLVATVQGYATHEKSTFEAVTNARAHWDAAATPDQKIAAAKEMDKAVQGFSMAINVENYPELKANQNFLELQAQLEGTENRIYVARTRYNDAVRSYNVKIKSFFTSIVANTYGYKERPFFEAEEGAKKAPKVNFT